MTSITQVPDQLSPAVDGNTRLESPDCAPCFDLYYQLDWLRVSGYSENVSTIEALILKYFNCEFDWSTARPYSHGRKIYPQSARTPNGIILAKEHLDGTVYKILLDISATPLMELSGECAWSFCRELHAMGLRCIRLDVAIDDYGRVLDFNLINAAGQAGDFALARTMKPFILYTSGKPPIITGFTFGSRESERFLRIYDKAIESFGKANFADCIRVEGEFKGGQADLIFQSYVNAQNSDLALDYAARCVLGIVAFIDKRDRNLDRCPVLPWWQNFIDAVGDPKRVRSVTLVRTVDTIVNFVERQVKRGLALLHVCLGEIWLDHAIDEWVSDAKKKFGNGERKFIERHNRLCAIDPSLGLPIY